MRKEKEFALNSRFNFCVIFGLLIIGFSFSSYLNSSDTIDLIFCAIGFILLGGIIFTPYCYNFDAEGISLCYLFLPVERYRWKDIRAIDVWWRTNDSPTHHRTSNFIFDIVFSIEGEPVGKQRLYMNGYIRKNHRTKRLLEKYWDGEITGYLFEGAMKWFKNKRAKKQTQIRTHLADAVIIAEREIRNEMREWLKPFIDQAKQRSLEIKVKYYYVAKDQEELNSRPNEGYTYTLVASISRFGETNSAKTVLIGTNLLYVRLGKNAYHSVRNKLAKEELEVYLTDVIKNGIEPYCKE